LERFKLSPSCIFLKQERQTFPCRAVSPPRNSSLYLISQTPHQKYLSSSFFVSSSLKAKPTNQPIKGVKKNPQAKTTHIPVLSSFFDNLIIFKIQKTRGSINSANRNKKNTIPKLAIQPHILSDNIIRLHYQMERGIFF
jgi:hypothetical protein